MVLKEDKGKIAQKSESQLKRRPFETYETTVDVVSALTPRNKGIRFRLPAGKEFHFRPGQFVQVFVPFQDGKTRRTSYSIASASRHLNYFELCVTKVEGGRSSTFIHSLKPGDKVTIMGPLGRFTLPEPPERDMVFIATGSGIAPFRSMIEDLIDRNVPKKIYLIFGNRYDGDIIYKEEWESLRKRKSNFNYLFTLSRPMHWNGESGYVQDKIQGFVENIKENDYFICGLAKMIGSVQEKLLSLGVPPSQVHFERYD